MEQAHKNTTKKIASLSTPTEFTSDDYIRAREAEMNATIDALQTKLDRTHRELDEIASLKRHMKRVVKRRLLRVDAHIVKKLQRDTVYKTLEMPPVSKDEPSDLLSAARTYDANSFERYVKRRRPHPLFGPYNTTRLVLKKSVKKYVARRIKRKTPENA